MPLDASDDLGCFLRSISNISSVSGSIPPFFEISKSFKALFTFPFSIKRANRPSCFPI